MAKPTLLPDPTCLHLKLLDASEATITVVVTTTSEEAEWPLCHRRSARIHSHSVREVADLPWMGCAVRLQLHVRRFFCPNQECERQIFTERLPSVVEPYARRTTRLTDVFTLIGFALGGEAGKRLATAIGLAMSPSTLLRLIRAEVEHQVTTPRVLGVDDFSFCKRKTYGTILIDLERRVPVDVLPDREAATFKEEQRLDWQQKYLTHLCEADPEIQESYDLIADFTTMLRERKGEQFDAWLQKVEEHGPLELKNFTLGLKRDYDAVKAGLTLEWSNGQTEGQVHRLKLIKRQMYGRGSFDLLRKRVLKRA